MSIKAVFFDNGGVITRTEYQTPRQHLAERFGMDYEDIEKIVFGGGPNGTAARATLGEIAEEEHWHSVMKVLKQPADAYPAIRDEFFAGDVVDRNLLNFIRSLKPNYQVGLISNAWSGLRDFIIREKFDDVFHHMIISAEVKAAKPEAKIYQIALEQFQVQAEEAVFVDDFYENIEACEKLGMKGIHFKDPESAIQQLKDLLQVTPQA